jgi:flavin-dependent dehydrogenase
MTFQADVFVIGGGPAGLAAAIAARQKGLTVILADGRRPPLDKACGEGLMPDTRLDAAALGIELPDSDGMEFRGIRFVGERCSVQGDFPRGSGLGLRRLALHERMVEAAERAGVQLRWGTPIASAADVPARWTIGADGTGSRVRKWACLENSATHTRRFAQRQHFALAPWSPRVEVHWGHGCQIYITPTAPNEICVALISRDPRLRLSEALTLHFPALAKRLRGAEPVSAERGAVTATRRLRHVATNNIALIGDASGSVDAITGEGIGLSFRQASLLADALAMGNLAHYNARHAALSFRPRCMAKLLLTMDRGRTIREGALGALSSVPSVFQKLLAVHVGA